MEEHMHTFCEEKDLCHSFALFDADGDGVISEEELKHAMMDFGEPLTDEELSDMFEDADVDKDGAINYKGKILHVKDHAEYQAFSIGEKFSPADTAGHMAFIPMRTAASPGGSQSLFICTF
jgi:hypothetical protein